MCVQRGISCLGVAAYNGHLEVVMYLCALGNKDLMAQKDSNGVSPLGYAKSQKLHHVVEYLKSVGMIS